MKAKAIGPVLACVIVLPVGACSAFGQGDSTPVPKTSRASDGPGGPVAGDSGASSYRQAFSRCSRTVRSASAAREAVRSAAGGKTVCLVGGDHGTIDLKNIDKPIGDRVTFRGMGERATSISELQWAGSSGLIIENLRATGDVHGAHQYPAHHITFRHMDVSSRADAFRGIGSYDNSGQHHIVIERNYIHDTGGYAIRAQGNAPQWTVRNNRFERIREDYIQSGEPTQWLIDRNIMGPGDFDRPGGYPGHPDLWQTLESGDHLTFTNNLVKDTNESLGFIFGDIGGSKSGFNDVLVRNNVFARVVYGVGETCQFSPGNGYVFERNTLVDARGCRWGGGEGADWPDGRNYSIKRNILSGNSHLSCNDTSQANSCRAFEAGESRNREGFDNWAETRFYKPKRLPGIGARLSRRDFQGFPFPAFCKGKEATITGTAGNDRIRGTSGRDVIVVLEGNDRVKAGGGDDVVCGGRGNDVLKGQAGSDVLFGEQGKDTLSGGRGKDVCLGGGGKDRARCERTRSA